jgi:hypothetical protein
MPSADDFLAEDAAKNIVTRRLNGFCRNNSRGM